jgi:hypothetical protein
VYACPGVRYRWTTTVFREEGWSRGWVGGGDVGDEQGLEEDLGEDPLKMDDRAVMAVLTVWYRYLTCGILLLRSGWSIRIRYHHVRSGSHAPPKYRVLALSSYKCVPVHTHNHPVCCDGKLGN